MVTRKFYLKLLMSLLLVVLAVPQVMADDVTIGDESTTNSYIPLYTYNFDYAQHNQIIYPAENLTGLVGKKITSITFYPTNSIAFGGYSVEVRLAISETSSFSSNELITSIPETASGTITPSTGDNTFVITLDQGFDYTGGNLVIDVQKAKGGNYGRTYFYGTTASSASAYSYSTYAPTTQNFLPKVTFTCEATTTEPTIQVDNSALNFSALEGASVSSTLNVTGLNLTGNISAVISNDANSFFSVSPASLSSTGGELTVIYNPTTSGDHTATLTLSSADAADVVVTLTGSAQARGVTVSTESLTLGGETFLAGGTDTKTFTVTNTTTEAVAVTLTDATGFFTVSPATIEAGATDAEVTVTYNPTASGSHNASIAIGDKSVALTGTASDATISGNVTPTTLNLTCQEGATATGTITVENNGNTVFTPVFSTLQAPFSISAAEEIPISGSKQFTVTFAPQTAANYTTTLTVSINGVNTQVTINGAATEAPEGGELAVPSEEQMVIGNKYLTNISPVYASGQLVSNAVGKYVQTMYPASLISDLNGKQITSMKFRAGALSKVNAKVQFSIGETSNSDLSSKVDENSLRNVAEIDFSTYSSSDEYMIVTFNTPYIYNGGNLVIQTKTTSSTASSSNPPANFKFYGRQTYDLGIGNVTVVNTSCSVPTSAGSTYTNQYNKQFLPQATFTYEKVAGVVVEPADGVLAFGEVSTTGSKTLNVTVVNKNSVAVPVSLGTLAAPFSSSFNDPEIAAGATAVIPVRFAPTEGIDYNGTFVVTIGGVDYTFTLTGTGHVNGPTMGEDDFAAITYDWTDSEGNVHEDTPMNEPATTPEQMIALMKAVYTNPNVPGNKYRGYTATGEKETDLVSYPAIGTVSNYDYSDSYGWGIPKVNDLYRQGSSYYLNPTDYLPNQEGLTVLLVEMNDQSVAEAKATEYGLPTTISGESTYQSTSSYSDLVKKFDVMFKSVRVLTSSKNIGAGETGGTLFKIDCDKMNRFFLLGKGRLRTYYSDNVKMTDENGNSYQVMTSDDVNKGPFYQMFEQFSPNVASSGTSAETDIYQKLVNMEAYGVLHDCVSVPTIDGHHEFNLYGVGSTSEDCQDVRDMMLFIPERRMTYWDASNSTELAPGYNKRDNSDIDHYVNYYRENAPKLGLFVIKQYPIDGEQVDGQNTYRLHLTWTSNLLDFLPGEDGQYTLYRVITNADGTKTYTPVVENLDPNTFEYDDYVDMQQNGQQVTYVVRGQDKEQFLTLQMSNEESFIIPGLDKAEQLQLALNADHYYSRFYPQTAKNYYSNRFYIKNNIGTNVKAKYLENGTTFTFYRIPDVGGVAAENIEEYVAQNRVPFATATVASKDNGNGTLTIAPVTTNVDYWDGSEYIYGYKTPATSATFTYDASNENSDVIFNDLKIIDNFSVSVEGNTHPNNYGYYVELQTAVNFDLADGTTSNKARSNSILIPTHKTAMSASVYDWDDVLSDTKHQLPLANEFDITVKQSSKSEILGYYAYRWNSQYGTDENPYTIITGTADNEQDISPNGQAGNQGEYYTVAMNSDYTGQVDFNGATTVQAPFIDNFIKTAADVYTYAPVVEVFAPATAVNEDGTDRDDYNTYGASLTNLASAKIDVEVQKYANVGENAYEWTDGSNTYTYYQVQLKVNVLDLPQGYEVAKVRVWRKIDKKYLGEQNPTQNTADYRWRINNIDGETGELLYIDKEDCQLKEALGDDTDDNGVFAGTFGALKLKNGEEIPMNFVVRIYFTKNDAKATSDNYYIAEVPVEDELTSDIPTFIYGVESAKEVVSIKYYNMIGVESDVPFQGVNIEVTTYTDGSRTSRKIMK